MVKIIVISICLMNYGFALSFEITKKLTPDLINDVEFNSMDNLVYVAFGNLDYISLRNSEIEEESYLYVGNTPFRIAFNQSYTQLATTLKGQGKTTIYNFDSSLLQTWDINTELNSNYTGEVIFGANNDLFISARDSGAHIARIDLSNGNKSRINLSIFQSYTYFSIDRNLGFMFLSSFVEPEGIYKIDLNEPGYPIIARDNAEVDRTTVHVLDKNKNKMITGRGQVLRTSSLVKETDLGVSGNPAFSFNNTELVFFNHVEPLIRRFDYESMSELTPIDISDCDFPLGGVFEYGIETTRNGWIAWKADILCSINYPDEIFSNGFDN